MIEPKLRFKADDGSQFPDWNEKTFNDVADYKKGPFGSALKKEIFVPKSNDTVKVYEQQNAIFKDWKLERYFVTNEYFQSKMKSFAVSGGDIIVSCAGTIGEMYELPHDAEEGIINQALMRVRIKKSVINSMIFRCVFDKMISTEGVKISNGSALKNIPPFADMKKQSVFVPSFPEQQKIADFLSTIDTVIEKQKETVSAWEERKKGVMQKLFNQEVRFKADDGNEFPEWEKKPFGDIVSEFKVKTKVENEDTLLSCAINGVFLNSELFGHQRGQSNIGYLKIKKGTLILSAQNLHLGNANVNLRFEHGIISPAYKTYDIVGCSAEYMSQWVKWDMTKQFFYNATTVGASECRRNVDWSMLYSQLFAVPCLAEQQKIADCLSSLDEVIEKQKATLAAWEEMKKGLLQQMFV